MALAWPFDLANSTTADANQVMADFNYLFQLINAAAVSSLPGSPVDGQIAPFVADPTNGVIWLLRYRAASDRKGVG